MSITETVANDEIRLETVDGLDLRLPLAGIGSRCYAFLIDWHIRLLAALAWLLPALWLGGGAELSERPPAILFAVFLPPSLMYFGYHLVLEPLMAGRTPGKRMAGLRVLTPEGGMPSVGALLSRNLFRLFDSLPALYGFGLIMMACTRQQLRLGDLAAGTRVVHDTRPRGATVPLGALPPKQAMLAQELLARWQELDPRQAQALAAQLLAAAGVAVPADSTAARSRRQIELLLAPPDG